MTTFLEMKVVPWSSYDEWALVYDRIFSENPQDVLEGLKIMEVWLIRGSVPVAVESTINFLRARNWCGSEESLRLMLSMSLVRFVNGILDQKQTQFYFKSFSKLAEKFNIPSYVIDLRHEASHTNLPTLEMLLFAIEDCQKWLRKNYWDPMRTSNLEFEKNLFNILATYSGKRKKLLRIFG